MSVTISVCICTYKRPRLLQSLLRQLEDHVAGTPQFDVVVVDNDQECSGEQCVAAFAARSRLQVAYLTQPIQNISLARNRAVHAASGEWLAMIDDDERPGAQWLLQLYAAAQDFGADIVLGPVISDLTGETAEWIRRGGFFDRPRYVTGTSVPYMKVRAGNLLVRRKAALALPGPFDPSFGLSGGEDVLMLEQLRARGHRIVWCDEAKVEEAVPGSRSTFSWILWRAFSGAQSYARVHRALGVSPMDRFFRGLDSTVRGFLLLPFALALALGWAPFNRSRSVHWLKRAVMQVGKLSVLLRLRYQPYGSGTGAGSAL